ncbi:hypothetical protein Ancab_033458 [Ancistrocladus abbreviatus]
MGVKGLSLSQVKSHLQGPLENGLWATPPSLGPQDCGLRTSSCLELVPDSLESSTQHRPTLSELGISNCCKQGEKLKKSIPTSLQLPVVLSSSQSHDGDGVEVTKISRKGKALGFQIVGGQQIAARGTGPIPSSYFLRPITPWCPVCCHESKCHRLRSHHRHLYSSRKLLTIYVPEQKKTKRHFFFVFKDLLRRSTPKEKGSFDDRKTFYNGGALGGKGGGLAVGAGAGLGVGLGIGGGEGSGEGILGGVVGGLGLGLGGAGGTGGADGDAGGFGGAAGGGGIIP